MIFGVWLHANGRIPHEIVDAPSWYDAREWARARYGEAFLDAVLLKDDEPAKMGFETTAIAPRATTTSHERHVEHIEAVEAAAFARGQRDGIVKASVQVLSEVTKKLQERGILR